MIKNMIILASLVVFGCSENVLSSEGEPHPVSISGTWKVVAYEDLSTGIITTKTVDNSWDKEVILTFDESTDPHEISGYSTTNQLSGEFLFVSESTIKISYFATEIAEPEWGNKFHWAMGSEILEYRLTYTNLTFYNNDRTVSVIFAKE